MTTYPVFSVDLCRVEDVMKIELQRVKYAQFKLTELVSILRAV